MSETVAWACRPSVPAELLAGCAVVGTIAAIVFERTFGSAVSRAEGVLAFFLLLMVVSVLVTVIVMIVRRWLYRARIEQRGFAVEVPAAQV